MYGMGDTFLRRAETRTDTGPAIEIITDNRQRVNDRVQLSLPTRHTTSSHEFNNDNNSVLSVDTPYAHMSNEHWIMTGYFFQEIHANFEVFSNWKRCRALRCTASSIQYLNDRTTRAWQQWTLRISVSCAKGILTTAIGHFYFACLQRGNQLGGQKIKLHTESSTENLSHQTSYKFLTT